MHRLTLAVALMLPACAPAPPSNRLTVGTEANYPPFEFKDDRGAITGFDVELLQAVAKSAGLEATFVDQPFAGLIPGLGQGKYDAAISCITITPERAAVVDFTDPYYDAGLVIAVPLKDTTTKQLSDVENRTIAVQQGTTGDAAAKKVKGATVKAFESTEMAFMEALAGRADAVINDEPTTLLYVKDHPGLRVATAPFTQENYGIAVKKGNAELLRKLNAGLQSIKADGTYARLKAKWIGR